MVPTRTFLHTFFYIFNELKILEEKKYGFETELR